MALNVTSNVGVIDYNDQRKYIAAASNHNKIMYSTNGINWKSSEIGETYTHKYSI